MNTKPKEKAHNFFFGLLHIFCLSDNAGQKIRRLFQLQKDPVSGGLPPINRAVTAIGFFSHFYQHFPLYIIDKKC